MSERYSFRLAETLVVGVNAQGKKKKSCAPKWDKLDQVKQELAEAERDETRAGEAAKDAWNEAELWKKDREKYAHYYAIYVERHKAWYGAHKARKKLEAKRDDAYEGAIACEQKNAMG